MVMGRWHRRRQNLGPQAGTHLPPKHKRERGQADHAVTEHPGNAVSQPLDRSLPGLGLLHHGDDPSQGGLRTHPLRLQHQGRFEVEAA